MLELKDVLPGMHHPRQSMREVSSFSAPASLLSLKSTIARIDEIGASTRGQNKSCSESYGKAERGMNIKPLVRLALAAEAI